MYKVWMLCAWIHIHKFALGLFADALTLAGAAALARDAVLRIPDLLKKRQNARFRETYTTLNTGDEELKAASVSVRWAISGVALIFAAFLCQLALRSCE